MIPQDTVTVTSDAYRAASDSSSGLEALQGPHQVAEKQTREWGWAVMKVVRSEGDERSCSAMVKNVTDFTDLVGP